MLDHMSAIESDIITSVKVIQFEYLQGLYTKSDPLLNSSNCLVNGKHQGNTLENATLHYESNDIFS